MHSYLFCANLFCADLHRGGKYYCPIENEQLLQLHTYCVKALNDKSAEVPSQKVDVDTGLYGQYVKFQVAYKEQIDHLKSGKFEEPAAPDQEKCVPLLLLKFPRKQKANAPQPAGNYSA